MSRGATCDVCWRHCVVPEGGTGFCRARTSQDGDVVAGNYGRLTSVAIDPVEKKPLAEWHPRARVLSVGSYGCNMRCPFCQNFEISQEGEKGVPWREVLPQELVDLALECAERDPSVIGIAHTYNEPLVGWEYVRDTGRLVRKAGMKNVIVTNGSVSDQVLDEILPVADAMNIDLKGFTENYYRKLGGDLETVKHFITCASRRCHVELTALIVPGENDSDEEMREMAGWISSLSPEIPLHVTRFFPRWKMDDRPATDAARVYALVQTAREYLRYVWTGNC